MLNSENLGKKTYEEWIAEAIGQIPIYSKEWTNFNASDPGITILENLTAFQILQQETLLTISDKVREKLLDLVGFEAKKENPATVLLKSDTEKRLLAHQKFYTGGICFETTKEVLALSESIKGIYHIEGKCYQNLIPELQKNRFGNGFALFGNRPKAGYELYFLFHQLPKPNQKLGLYVETGMNEIRNENSTTLENIFAVLEFSILTEEGNVVIENIDDTEGFIRSGQIILKMPKQAALHSDIAEQKGYFIKCLLKEADYDIAPLVKEIHSFLFPVVQRETKSIVLKYPPSKKIIIEDAMIEQNYLDCFCKKEGFYYKYNPEWREKELYFSNLSEDTDITEICCVLSDEEIMIHRQLGTVIGYDNQEISLEPFIGIRTEEFYVMTKIKTEKEEDQYQLFAPNEVEEGSLQYRLDYEKNCLIITDAGDYEGAKLLLAGCVLFRGEEGNIRRDNEFSATTAEGKIQLKNPAPGSGGRYNEKIEERIRRFSKDMHHPVSLVTQGDYEDFIKKLPELCIHKVNAYTNPDSEKILLVVKPYGIEKLPKISALYRKIIVNAIEEKRMLSTRIQLLQPVYTAIHVSGTIYIKEYYKNYKERIEETIRNLLDYVTSEKKFGETISFYEIYGIIEKLECVDEIFDLSFIAENNNLAKRNGLDLKLAPNCLCYAGDIQLEFHTQI